MKKRSSRTHAPCGGRIRPDGGWQAYLSAVAEAAKAAKRAERPKHARTQAQLDALRPGRVYLIDKAPRCAAMARSTGKPCARAAVRGSTFCPDHGGLLEVPSHPAAIRKWGGEAGQRMLAAAEARKGFFAYPATLRAQVSDAFAATNLASRRRRGKWPTLLAGAQALSADDGGRTWRRWLAELQASENNEGNTAIGVEA